MKSLKHLTTFSVVIFALFVGPIITLGQARAGNPSASAGGTDKVASGQKMAVKAAKTIPASTALFSLEEVKPGLKGVARTVFAGSERSEEHTSELQSHSDLVCRLLLEKKKKRENKCHT